MIAEFKVTSQDAGPAAILRCSGYLNAQGGAALWSLVESLLQAGKTRFVVNFLDCSGINSQGVTEVIQITVMVSRDFRGKLVLCGLDDLKRKVFHLAGILQDAHEAMSEEEALSIASS